MPEFVEEFLVLPNDFVSAGDASRKIKQILKKIGLDANLIRKIAIASYEAEMNMVIHSLGGTVRLSIEDENIIVTCKDRGPGIEDIDKAMEEGFSTASEKARAIGFGAGMGLPNIKNNSDELRIESDKDGTTLNIYFNI